MLTREFPIRVWYVDTDQMGIVHHSNYVKYYESARSDLMRAMGLSYAEMERRGVMMPILEVTSKYLASAHYDELITVKITLAEEPRVRVKFLYEIYNEQGVLLNTGSTTLGFMNSTTRRPTRAPQWFIDMLRG
ncbi:MAG: thioesterase family protein [Rikenellaceae bacterium]